MLKRLILIGMLGLATVSSVFAQEETPEPPTDEAPFIGIFFDQEADQVIIEDVQSDSPADVADLQAGDIILSIDGTDITSENVAEVVDNYAPDDVITLSIERDGEVSDVELTLGVRPPMRGGQDRPMRPGEMFEFRMPMGGAFLGIALEDTDDGVQITNVVSNSPAAEAELQEGDIILGINGEAISTAEAIIDAVRATMPADGLEIEISRDGEIQTITVEMLGNMFEMPGGERGFMFPPNDGRGPRDNFPPSPHMRPDRPLLGVSFVTLTPDNAAEYDVDFVEGAFITAVMPGTPANNAGIKRGDIITAVDGDMVDVERTLADRLFAYEQGDSITLTLLRDSETVELDVTLGIVEEQSNVPMTSNPA